MKLTGVIFDWAGTMVDHGSRAPVAALQQIFEHAGVPVTLAEIRLSMGIAKKDHIREILALPRVTRAWREKRRALPAACDVDSLYAEFLPRQTECLPHYSTLIRGVPETAAALRERAVRIGSTTGYTRPMLEFLLEAARKQGFAPDSALCPEDVPGGGRPHPWMCYLTAVRLQVAPMWSMIKIGDTPSDIEEGRNAGMWTIGVTRTGNETGLTEDEWNAATDCERRTALSDAEQRLRRAGAHRLVESAGDCLSAIDEIEARIAHGERP